VKTYHVVRTKKAFTDAVVTALSRKEIEWPNGAAWREICKGNNGEPWVDRGDIGFEMTQIAVAIGFVDPPLELIATVVEGPKGGAWIKRRRRGAA
jgi:hypothetical protein